MRDDVLDALTMVIDPEIGIDIVALGLVERLDCTPERIDLGLIMTTPICPQGHHLVEQARDVVQSRFPNAQVNAELLMEPFWDPSRMSPMARQTLGWGG